MTQRENFCPRHGPYDASLPQCPYCAMENGKGEFPPKPTPLDADEISPHRSWEGGRSLFSEQAHNPNTTKPDFFVPEEAPAAAPNDETEHTVVLNRGPSQEEADPLLGIFWVKEGPLRGSIFPLSPGCIIGRKHGEVRLPDPTISDPHAKITVEEHHFVLWDFGSANGTFVNGRRIREATPIKENDEIRFGNTLVVLKTLT